MPPPVDRGAARERRPRFGWVHVVVAVIVGVLLGAAGSLGRIVAATEPRAVSLETLARDYLQAIADGDAERATTLAPLALGRVAAPQAMLATAERLRPTGVGPALVDGDEGVVEVRYRVGGAELARQLRATQRGGLWRLSTTLAEAPDTAENDPTAVLRVAGITLPRHGELYLYPAVYRLDAVAGPLFATDGGSFVIDGDPGTSTHVRTATRLMDAFAARLASLAVDAIDACRARPACPIRARAQFEPAGEAVVLQTFDDGRAIDLKVPMLAWEGSDREWRDVIVRVALDSRGLPVDWRCSILGEAEAVRCGD